MRLTLLLSRSTCAISHTFTPTPEQTHSCRQTYTPIHKPLHRCLLCWVQECVELMWNVWFLGWLWSRHIAVPTCAPKWSMSTISGLCQRLNLLQGILGISATQHLLLPFLPALLTHSRTLFIQRHGGWTPFTHREERKQRWDTGKKSSRDMQTRVSVWAQTAAEVGLFLELRRIHPMNLHYWNSTHVST